MSLGDIISDISRICDHVDDYLKNDLCSLEKRSLELRLIADTLQKESDDNQRRYWSEEFDDFVERDDADLKDFSDEEEISSWLSSMGVSEEEYDAMDEQEQEILAFEYGYNYSD